jgi:WD40 repeat protein
MSRDEQLDEIITAYLKACETGPKPDPADWLTRYPGFAADLADFFAGQGSLDRIAAPLRQPRPVPSPGHASETHAHGETPTAVRPGKVIRYFGDYELLEEIARGGMGVVYRARQMSLDRPVALKMILAGQLASDDDVRRFRQEAEAAANLDHPHIVPIYEVGEHDGKHFFSMKLIEGTSLNQCLDRFRADPRGAAQLLARVARAVHHAHQRGLLHRDLKPGNILVDAQGQPHVTDFGLAKRVEGGSELTVTGAIVGTPEYMAPEQALARKVLTTGVDIYSLGAVFYTLLTEGPPFVGGNVLETLQQGVGSEPVPPRRRNARVPLDLEVICLKCLAKEAEGRYSSAEALAEDLERWLRGEPILARPAGRVERGVKWVRRNPVVAGLSAALVLAIAAGLLAFYVKYREAQEKTMIALDREQEAHDETTLKEEALARVRHESALKDRALTQAREENRNAQENLASSNVLLAQTAWKNNDVWKARACLEQVPDPFRHWEWYYLKRQFEGGLFTLYGHTGPVWDVAFSPDGTRLATVSDDGSARLWDPRTGRALLELTGSMAPVRCLAFSPDGKRLFTIGFDRKVRLWDSHTGRQQREFVADPDVRVNFLSLALSRDGSRLATAAIDGPGRVRIWNADTGELLLELKKDNKRVDAVAFSPDGMVLATTSYDKTARLYDARTGEERRVLPGHNDHVVGVAFSPDGGRLATRTGDGTVRLWDAGTGQLLLQLKGVAMGALAFSPDGARLAIAGGTVAVWDARTGQQLLEQKGHTDGATAVAFSPDGARLATAGRDGTVRIWDARAVDQPLVFKGHTSFVQAVVFSRDGTRLATAGADTTARVWDAQTGQPLLEFRGHSQGLRSVALSPDGTRLATGCQDGTARLWDAFTSQFLLEIKAHATLVQGLAFSPDGKRLATAGGDGMARLWDTETRNQLLELQGHKGPVTGVVFSPAGERLATSGGDRARVWDTASGKQLLELLGGAACVAFSPDGTRLTTGGWDRTVRVWDARTGQPILVIPIGNLGGAGLALSPDGARLATVWLEDVQIWDVRSGQPLLNFKGHRAGVGSVAFSSDGMRLATASSDRLARIWDVRPVSLPYRDLPGNAQELQRPVAFNSAGTRLATTAWNDVILWDTKTGRSLFELKGHTKPIQRLVFSLDGSRLATANADNTVRLWDTITGQSLRELKDETVKLFGLALNPDGTRLATRDSKGRLKLWDVTSGKQLFDWAGDRRYSDVLAFSPDGKHFAAVFAPQGIVRVWDAQTGKLSWELKSHAEPVFDVTFNADGTQLTGRSVTREVVWDTATGQPLPGVVPAAPPLDSRRSPDGRWLVLPGFNSPVVRLVNLAQPLDDLERARRAWAARTNPDWHGAELVAARAANDWYAAVFHSQHLLEFGATTFMYEDDKTGTNPGPEAILADAVKRDPKDTAAQAARARFLLKTGKLDEYRKTCAALSALAADARNEASTRRLAAVCVLAPNALPDLQPLLAAFEKTLTGPKKYPEDLRIQSGLLLRAGKPENAVKCLLDARKDQDETPHENLLLALAYHQLKRPDDARLALTRAVAALDRTRNELAAIRAVLSGHDSPLHALIGLQQPTPPDWREQMLGWQGWLELQILRKEAEAALMP